MCKCTYVCFHSSCLMKWVWDLMALQSSLPLCSLWCTALVSGTPQSQTSCFSLRLWLHPLMTRESARSNVQHCFNTTGLVAALRHYCCPSYPFSNLLSDEPPPMKLPPETDLSESMAAEKEAGQSPPLLRLARGQRQRKLTSVLLHSRADVRGGA